MVFLVAFVAKLLSPILIGLGFLAGFAVRRPLLVALSVVTIAWVDEIVMSALAADRRFEPVAFGIGAFAALVWRHVGSYARRGWAERLKPRPGQGDAPDEAEAPSSRDMG